MRLARMCAYCGQNEAKTEYVFDEAYYCSRTCIPDETYTCKGCGETYEVNQDPEWREPIHGRCADCWDEFQRNDLAGQFEEAMEV